MGVLRVIDGGLQTTVQDLGRSGHAASGVAHSGAADALSLRIGNRLLGNNERCAALEMTLIGGVFRFQGPALVCLAGSPTPSARIRSESAARPIRTWTPAPVNAGDELDVGAITGGSRTYLCFAGGVRTPAVLASRSTHVASGLGGLGRALAAGDELAIGEPTPGVQVASLAVEARCVVEEALSRRTLRVVPGAHHGLFTGHAINRLTALEFRVSDRSDRVGVRLAGAAIDRPGDGRLSSEGMVIGSVQAPPGGEPIVLGVDGPTTGGYPVIAAVIAADLPALGQCRPRDTVRFEWIDRANAVALLRQHQAVVASVGAAVRVSAHYARRSQERRDGVLHLACDTGEAPPGPGREREIAMLRFVSAVSIACGGHAGDEESMREMVSRARDAGCVIGAHPSYPDRVGFGRKPMTLAVPELVASIREQIASLRDVCDAVGVRVSFVKPHGALYHAVSSDEDLAAALANVSREVLGHAAMVGQAGAAALEVWRSMGLEAWPEAFIDRLYEPDGALRSREKAGALIDDPARAARQAVRLARGDGVEASDGSVLPVHAVMLCIHADTPDAERIAGASRRALDSAGVRVGDPRSP
ncbi:MAG: 5-oxoprolinase/urea amidolyase family protein [Phycisphaeraceae bacterium]|nr:MAG: 5-oxoprolinase/urea amidolyase family protein [Phycisphaeraceae bacterium]